MSLTLTCNRTKFEPCCLTQIISRCFQIWSAKHISPGEPVNPIEPAARENSLSVLSRRTLRNAYKWQYFVLEALCIYFDRRIHSLFFGGNTYFLCRRDVYVTSLCADEKLIELALKLKWRACNEHSYFWPDKPVYLTQQMHAWKRGKQSSLFILDAYVKEVVESKA